MIVTFLSKTRLLISGKAAITFYDNLEAIKNWMYADRFNNSYILSICLICKRKMASARNHKVTITIIYYL